MAKKRYYRQGSFYRKRRKNTRTGRSEEYGNYLIKFKDATGKTRYQNLGTADRNDAEILFADWIATRARGEDTILGGDMTVKEYFEAHMAKRAEEQCSRNNVRAGTIRRYRNIFTPFLNYLDAMRLAHVTMKNFTTAHLSAYLDWRANQSRFNGKSKVMLTKRGVNKEYKLIRGVFRKAFAKRVIPVDITEEVVMFTVEVKQKTLPTLGNIMELIERVKEREVADFIMVATLTGARTAELTHLKWENIDFDKSRMSILPEPEGGWKAKNKGSYRTFDMPPEVETIFKGYRRQRMHEQPDSYIFKMAGGRAFKDYPNYVYRRLTKALNGINRGRRKVGVELIPKFTPHTLRHWFISWSLTREDNPLSEIELTQIVGHADLNMIRDVYFHGDPQWATAKKVKSATLFTDYLERRA